MTPMDVWASLAQVVKDTSVHPASTKNVRAGQYHSAYSAALSWLSLDCGGSLAIALLDRPSYLPQGGKDLAHWACRFQELEAPTSGVPGAEHNLRLRALQLKGCEVG